MARKVSAKEIGRRIRLARERVGMTGGALAEKIGTDKGTISRIERGGAGISTDRLQDIAAALAVDPGVLLAPPEQASRPAPRRSAARTVST